MYSYIWFNKYYKPTGFSCIQLWICKYVTNNTMKPINVVPGRSKYLGKQAYLGLGEGTNIIYENSK